jgi:LysR family transcriptional regulator, hydrogen peroxide-inducible genes activator
MNLRDLKYLIALAQHEHFGKAAESCFVSQPTLSMQIKKLEGELGVQLIERNNKQVLITPVGRQVVARAERVINEAQLLVNTAKKSCDPCTGELTIGLIPTLAPYLLPKIMPRIVKKYPNLKLYLVEQQTDTLLQRLRRGEIDSAILALPVPQDGHVCRTLFEEDFLLATSSEHALSKRKRIKQRDLEGMSLLLLEEGHCLRDNALSICQMNNAGAPESFKATSLETLRQMVAANMGITLIPKLAQDKNKHIHYIEFSNPKPQRTIGMTWRHSSSKQALLEEIALCISSVIDA